MLKLSRRTALTMVAASPLASLSTPAFAKSDRKGVDFAKHRRFMLGNFEVTTLLAATATRDDPQSIFGMNVSPEEFAAVSEAAFLPVDKVQFFFTPTVVNTGSELVLFDTGLNAEGIVTALNAADYTPDQIDTVVITHMHGDHVGGLIGETGETFPNARLITGSVEHNYWTKAGGDAFEKKVKPLNDKFTFIDDGASVASGIHAVSTFGHTPGHTSYMIESGGQQLMLIADLANHAVWSLAKPDWEVRFDMDKATAAASRRKIFNMLATDKIPMIGYHMPFPAVGYVAEKGDGFEYVPMSYQMMLG